MQDAQPREGLGAAAASTAPALLIGVLELCPTCSGTSLWPPAGLGTFGISGAHPIAQAGLPPPNPAFLPGSLQQLFPVDD